VSFTIDIWMSNGTYSLSNIIVQNDAGINSLPYKAPVNLIVGNTNSGLATTPTVNIDISTTGGIDNGLWAISRGGTLFMLVTAISNAPVNMAFFMINNTATGTISSGGGGAYNFIQVANNTWQTYINITFNKFSPPGIYQIVNFYVENTALLSSPMFPSLSFKVINSLLVGPPKLLNVVVFPPVGGNVIFTVRANSFAPVNFLFYTLIAPNGVVITGGGGYYPFTKEGIISDFWDCTFITQISTYRPSGVYNISNVAVMNDASQWSIEQVFATFIINNSYVSDIPKLLSVQIAALGRYMNGSFWVTLKIITAGSAPIEYIVADVILEGGFPTQNISEILLGNGNRTQLPDQTYLFYFTYNTNVNPGLICTDANSTSGSFKSASEINSTVCVPPIIKTGPALINGVVEAVEYCYGFTINGLRIGNEGLKESSEWKPLEVYYTNCEKGSMEILQTLTVSSVSSIKPTLWLVLIATLLLKCIF